MQSETVEKRFFMISFVQTIVKLYDIILIIYDPINEVIVEWKK